MICVVCIYLIGGQLGAYTWNIAIFILSPVAALALVAQLVILTISLFRRKRVLWNVIFITISIVFAMPLTVLFGISPVTYPTKADLKDSITITMPVENGVLFGGRDYKTHAMWPSECYAYDILMEPYDVGSTDLNAYGIFGADVVSPISGTVIATEDNEADIVPNSEEFISSLGNYIFIEIDTSGTYLILAHLKENSVLVNAGEHVEEGQLIGKVGNSGTTSEPHLHIQHQRNNPTTVHFPICAEGLPIEFK